MSVTLIFLQTITDASLQSPTFTHNPQKKKRKLQKHKKTIVHKHDVFAIQLDNI